MEENCSPAFELRLGRDVLVLHGPPDFDGDVDVSVSAGRLVGVTYEGGQAVAYRVEEFLDEGVTVEFDADPADVWGAELLQ